MNNLVRTSLLLMFKAKTVFVFFVIAGTIFLLANCNTSNVESNKSQPEVFLAKNLPTETITFNPDYNYFGPGANIIPQDIVDSSQVALCQFAWREFIAVNWPSSYNTTSHTRGKPDTNKDVNTFLSPDPNVPLVWQTYKHRVEIYPDNTSKYDTSFNSAPKYLYSLESQSSITRLGDPTAPVLSSIDNIFNNLDETTQINLCTIFFEEDPNAPGADKYPNAGTDSGLPGAPRRLLFEAKGNQDMFDYVVNKQLYDSTIRANKILSTLTDVTQNGTGGIFPCPDNGQICFPFGGDNGAQGNILVKATWKQLTLNEYNSGKYLTSPVIYYRKGDPDIAGDTKLYYDIVPAEPTATTLPYGLAGLHIIHKTVNYPTYVFATFEQVDNLTNDPSNDLFYYNRNSNPAINPNKQYAQRYAPILAGTTQITDEVHKQIRALDSTSVWQYYKLIGVQGKPQNNDNSTDYFLANIVTETNQTLRDFSGTLDTVNGTIDPTGTNLYQGKIQFVQGGCKGCHGNTQKTDFSFITRDAPFDEPDVINESLLK